MVRVVRCPLHKGRATRDLLLNRGHLSLGGDSGFFGGLPVPLRRVKLGLESIGFALQLDMPFLEAGLLKPQLLVIFRDKGLADLRHLLLNLHLNLRLPRSKGLLGRCYLVLHHLQWIAHQALRQRLEC